MEILHRARIHPEEDRIHRYMHGRVIIMPAAQLRQAIEKWSHETAPDYSHPHI